MEAFEYGPFRGLLRDFQEKCEKKVRLSRLLKWYGEDFRLDFGTFQNERRFTPIENAVLSFVAHYIAETDQLIYLEEKNYKIKNMTFDWSPSEWVSDAV